ncbi:hypothetical protein [Colwellia hornerae]|uniref:Uncharacterized protein n=1 Tax=Colwellia hornerae TaxID=89402 RepID=A0A5C6QMW7_9GAMM|nr:hypothetical protein [Colwellia hornerae]TWX53727.1 hypothetical protein ESZ28_09615 [Colwellia hornerae]TWX60377.1 hypothetical protein ESZ26_08390 [Colwellia hornerae]TWX70133.1 hypothetical protein ESZ27_05080 [Colwellia hornerae]
MTKYFAWLSPLCLVIIFIATLITEWSGYQPTAMLALFFLVLFILLEWKNLDLTSKVIVLVAINLTLLLLLFSQISLLQLNILSRGVAFFAFFLIALGLLKEAAMTSNSVNLTGLMLLQQQPVRRYALLTFASHILGILMSVGAINLLGTMIQRSLDDNKDIVDARIINARQRRMMLAVLRGFCSVPLWAPTSITITLLVTTIPNLQWIDIIPYGLYLTFALLLFGIWLDKVQAPKNLGHLVPTMSNNLADLKVSYPILMVVITLALVAGALMLSTSLRPIAAVLVSAPLVSVAWIFSQYQRKNNKLNALQLTVKRFSTDIFFRLALQRSEIVFFTSSVLIGRLLLTVVDLDWFAHQLDLLDISAALILIAASWIIFIAALLFISPMISVTLMAGALSQLPSVENMPVTLALVMMVTWAVVAGSSPSTTSVRINAKITRISPTQMGLQWNGLYSILVLLLLDFFVILMV